MISGPAHSGKTSLVASLLQPLCLNGWHVSGILAEGHWRAGRRSGFTLIDLGTGRRTPLADRVDTAHSGAFPYVFDPQGLAAGRHALAAACCAHVDLVVVDEVGRLEIGGQGWSDLLAPLLCGAPRMHLWVVQSAWMEAVCRKWRLSPAHIVDASDRGARPHLLTLFEKIQGNL